MCAGFALERRSLHDTLFAKHALESRLVTRNAGAEPEIHFLSRTLSPLLPVWIGRELHIIEWGNMGRSSAKLPRTFLVTLESITKGLWNALHAEEVEIPVSLGLEKGVWFHIPEGVKGMLVSDEKGSPHVYLLRQPASHYYE